MVRIRIKSKGIAVWQGLAFLWMTILLAAAFLCACVSASDSQVFDRAGLFKTGERLQLEQRTDRLRSAYDMDFLVVTTDDTDGASAEEYADGYYEEHGYADNHRRGGILILIDMDNREIYLCTNRDMIYYMTDRFIEETLDEGYDYIADREYAAGIFAMLDQIETVMERGIDSSRYMIDRETGKITRYRSLTASDLLIALAVPLVIAGAACFGVYHKYRTVPRYEYAVGQNTDIQFRTRQDQFVNQFVTKRRIPRNPPPSDGGFGGGSGGGSTVHTSGGGHTFGGGGRKF